MAQITAGLTLALPAGELVVAATAETPQMEAVNSLVNATGFGTAVLFEPIKHSADALLTLSDAELAAETNYIGSDPSVLVYPASLVNVSSFGDLAATDWQADAAAMASHANAQAFGDLTTAELPSGSVAVLSHSNAQAFGAVVVSKVGVAGMEAYGNLNGFADFAWETSPPTYMVSLVNLPEFGQVATLNALAMQPVANAQQFGTLAAGAILQIEGLLNTQQFGDADVWTAFVPSAHHVKLYGVALGDLDLSDRVTSVNGTKDATTVYLSVVMAGYDIIDAITARSAEQLRFYAYWRNSQTGRVDASADLMVADFSTAKPSVGGRSASITLSGQAAFASSRTISKRLDEVEYWSSDQLRAPVDMDLNVGDTATHANGSLVVGRITYTVGPLSKFMTLSAA